MTLPIKTFSPTQTDAFAFCPRYWGFYRQHLKPKWITYPEIAAIVGTAVARGLETFYLARKAESPMTNDAIEHVAVSYADVLKEQALACGHRYVSASEQDKWEAIASSVCLCLNTHARHDPFLGYEVVEVEQTGEDHDRPDLVLRDQAGPLIVDFKCKLTLRAEWVKKEHAKWRRSWGLHHYAVRRGIQRFAVALIAPHTRQGVHYEITQVNEGYAKLWQQDAAQLWAEMDFAQDMSLQYLRGNTSHSNEYGECPFWPEACSHGMDPVMLANNLVKIERVPDAGLIGK